MKIEVGTVGLVGQAEHAVGVSQLHNGLQVGADAVVSGVVYQHRLGVRVGQNGPLHLADLHAQGDAQAVVTLRVDIDGDRAAQHHGAHDAAVHVPGQDNLLSALDRREYHALHGAGGAAHHQEGMGRAECVRRQLLRVPDNRDRVAQVVQRLHRVDVHAHAGLAQQLGQLRVASAPLVAGNIKRNHTHAAEALQRLIDWRAGLVQNRHASHLLHQ